MDMDTDRSRSFGMMDGHMDKIDHMDMNWMDGRNERRFRSRSNSVHRTRSA